MCPESFLRLNLQICRIFLDWELKLLPLSPSISRGLYEGEHVHFVETGRRDDADGDGRGRAQYRAVPEDWPGVVLNFDSNGQP